MGTLGSTMAAKRADALRRPSIISGVKRSCELKKKVSAGQHSHPTLKAIVCTPGP